MGISNVLFNRKKIPEESCGTARIQWPNDDIEDIEYYSYPEYVTIHDMGHKYEQKRYRLQFNATLNGHPITLDLSDIKILEIKPDKNKDINVSQSRRKLQ